jgi:chromosome segregation ATPase
MKLKEKEILELKETLKNKEEIIKNQEKIIKELKEEKAKLIRALKDIRRAIKTLNKYIEAYNKEDYKRISELQYILRKENIEDIRQIYKGINELMTNLVIKLKNDKQKNIVKNELKKVVEQYNLDSTLDM